MTGVQTCALPICLPGSHVEVGLEFEAALLGAGRLKRCFSASRRLHRVGRRTRWRVVCQHEANLRVPAGRQRPRRATDQGLRAVLPSRLRAAIGAACRLPGARPGAEIRCTDQRHVCGIDPIAQPAARTGVRRRLSQAPMGEPECLGRRSACLPEHFQPRGSRAAPTRSPITTTELLLLKLGTSPNTGPDSAATAALN